MIMEANKPKGWDTKGERKMMISPFVEGLAIGSAALMITVLVFNIRMKKMDQEYRRRLRARELRIQELEDKIKEGEDRERRKRLMREIKTPLH